MQNWSIGIYEGPSPLRLGPAEGVPNPVLTRADIHDLDAAFVADPFTLRVGDRSHMFFEIYDRATGTGRIGHAHSADHRAWTYNAVVLAEDFHLSYPFVFAHGGRFYLVPETRRTGQVRLYMADAFPASWRLAAILLNRPLADPTLIHHDGRWWMYACGPHNHDHLYLFHAATLLGPWAEHPASPVVAGDPGKARPAGRPVVWNNQLVRYAQDCRGGYGMGVRAFTVTDLTSQHHRETPIPVDPFDQAVRHAWNRAGMHHVDPIRLEGTWLACVDGWSTA
ncbi:glucosamine inositolphosphorylceramide transferase family protein [Actinomadura citrea]|uniref:glucosamine inositolphosphorylceramide transferase family protein n=1 Tax=Actinomadura citrea TaxID=46158 RepID=UPI003CE5AC13